MPRIGLALSGGGFRATLFHLGVVRFLRDAGLLANVSHIVSVSGGSILSAHLVLNWDRYNGSTKDFDEVAAEITRFVQLDVRNRIVRRLPLAYPFRLLQRLTRHGDSRRFMPSGILEGLYDKFLYGNRTVHDLPENPELHILATNVSEGCLCSFNRDGLIMQRRGEGTSDVEHLPARLAKISLAVASSSAFPGFFPPVRITAAEIGLQEGQFPTQAFTDGGVYDNLGVRAFDWLKDIDPPLDEILVSDTGQMFRILPKKPIGMVGQAMRASDILWDRVWQLEKQNFGSDPRFLFIPSTDVVDPKEDPTALDPIIQPEVQNIRTDLDRFSPLEIRALVAHGYCVARKKCRLKTEIFGTDLPSSPPWNPLALPQPPAKKEATAEGSKATAAVVASPGLQDATAAARQLQHSADRRILSTLLDFRDWPTYVYIPLLILLFIVLPIQMYRTYRQARTNEMVIDAIANGDPEFRKILELVQHSPPLDFSKGAIRKEQKPFKVDYSGLEMMETTRILDLRRWTPEKPTVYYYSRTRLRKTSDYAGDNKVRFNTFIPYLEDFGMRLEPKSLNPVLVQTYEKVVRSDLFAGEAEIWQLEYDLTSVPTGKPVELMTEGQYVSPPHDDRSSSVTFPSLADTAVTNVWILFPENRPYRKYELLRYEPGKQGEPFVVEPRYNIDHPYGFIIGWSMINAKKGQTFTCKWEWKK